jgi:DNA-binding LacI/PurR family transcriptional regulator
MGAVATRLLVERVGAPYAPPTETVLPTRWIERNSIAAPAAS